MSQVLFAANLKPQAQPGFQLEKAVWPEFADVLELPVLHRFPGDEKALAAVPDHRSYRVLNRAGLLLQRLAPAASAYFGEPVDPYRVGIYGALELGSPSYRTAPQAAVESDPSRVAALLRQSFSPKQLLRIGSNFQTAEIAIAFGVRGPLNQFIHGEQACLHALDQAEFDLRTGVVDRAIVCSASGIEDPMTTMKILSAAPRGTQLSEGAAMLVLGVGGTLRDWQQELAQLPPAKDFFFGIAHPLVRLVDAKEGTWA